tara:strand:+ start:3520 stop:5550 length:2031 start_codon:yes stop_codon:yes gene_type:complete
MNRHTTTFYKNPNNPKSTLFKRLTKLLSGPLVNYRQQQVHRDRRHRLDKYAKKFRSASGQQFRKKSYNPYDNLTANRLVNQNRAERYLDFDQMEYDPVLHSAMDVFADEITTHNEFGNLLTIDCPNEEIKTIIHSLFYKVLNVEFNLYNWARTLIKYGDFFMYLDIDERMGVKSVIGLPAPEIERMEGEDPSNPSYVQFQWNSAGLTLENWQVAHFRILGNDKYAPYGESVLDPARRVWRQLSLLEDAMMAYRIVRAPDRRVFYIDVGGIPAEDVEEFMQKTITSMKRHQVLDPENGNVDLRYNPASIEEDFFIPVHGGISNTKIETLQGTSWGNDIDDVQYLLNKMFAAIKIPMSYLIRGEGADEDKTTLAQKDVRFARTIQRLQRSLISELEKIAIIHLYTLGFKGDDLISFKLKLYNPSKIAQLQELEHLRTKLELAASAKDSFFSGRWIAENILDISKEEFVRNQRERYYDAKLEMAMAAIAQVSGEAAGMGEMGALGGGDIGGGEMDFGGEMDLGGDEEMDLGAGGEAPDEGGGFEGLMASPDEAGPPPASRDDNWEWRKMKKVGPDGKIRTITNKSKGKWYEPEPSDKRDMGARKKNMLSQAGHSQGGKRRTHPGYHNLDSLTKGIVSESVPNYNTVLNESRLINTNNEMEKLLKSLEKMSNGKEEEEQD